MMKKYASVLWKTIKLSISVSPVLFIINTSLSILASFFGVLVVYFTTNLFNQVEQNLLKPEHRNMVYSAIVIFFLVLLIKELITWLSDYFSFVMAEKSNVRLTELLHEKTNKIGAIHFENPKLLDYIENASGGPFIIEYCSRNVINLFLRDIPYLIFIGFYLYSLEALLFLIPVLIFIPVIFSQVIRTKMYLDLRDERAPLERKMNTYKKYITDSNYYKETRTLGCYSFFKNLYVETMDLLTQKLWDMDKHTNKLELLSRLVTLLGYYSVLALLAYFVINQKITVGAFASVFASIQMLYTTTEHIVCNKIGSILMDDFAEIDSFIRFMEVEDRVYGEKEHELQNKIKLQNVSFQYPNREENVIDHANLEINKGDVIAIVGENGSGKTTLAKLILGLYLPTSGSISMDHIEINKLSRKSLFYKKSAVFQDFYKYLFNLDQNISISAVDIERNRDRLILASEKAGVEYENTNIYPAEYDTLLTKRFGGVELSGGEWQRVAIARGFYKDSDFIILDEPTSAIDPIEESHVYKKFVELTKGKTSIIITHRLGSAKIANKIIVMEHGRIVQIGTHEELISKSGLYKTMYESQASWYFGA